MDKHEWTSSGNGTHPTSCAGAASHAVSKNVGFGFGFPEQAVATIELHGSAEIERVVVRDGGADIGQGAHTVLAQMTASACDVSLDKVAWDASDTAIAPNSGATSASCLTRMVGGAIQGAAELALHKWWDEERPAIATYQYHPQATTDLDAETGAGVPNFAYGYVAQYVEVEVDVETGHMHVPNVVCAVDAGRAINPQQVEGQIEGAVVQAHGYAIQENFIMEGGFVSTPYLSNYLLPTALDTPRCVQSVILEIPDPDAPWSVRGVAEMGYLPYVAAVVAALYDATGVWLNDFPLTPDRVHAALCDLPKAAECTS